MARIVMNKAGDKAAALNDGDSVYGGDGDQSLLVFTSGIGTAKNVTIGGGVEKVNVQAKATDMSLKYNPATGYVEVTNTLDGSVIAHLQPQTDANGTQVATADGSFFLKMGAGADGKIVPQISNGTAGSAFKTITDDYKPVIADIDASQKTETGGSGDTPPPTPGADQTFILTPGTDISGVNLKSVAGSLDNSGNDLFMGTLGGTPTLTAGDTIDGGSGTNVMKLVLDNVGTVQTLPGISIKNMQTVEIAGTIATSGGLTLNAASMGLGTVVVDNVVNGGTSDANNNVINVASMANDSTFVLKGAVTGFLEQGTANSGAQAIQGQYVDAATDANVTLDNFSGRTLLELQGKGLTSVDVTGSMTNTGVLYLRDGLTASGKPASAADDTITTVNINSTGAAISLTGSKIATVNGSESSGNLVLEFAKDSVANDLTVKTGAGNDTIIMALEDLSSKDSIDFGTGSVDALTLKVSAAANSANAAYSVNTSSGAPFEGMDAATPSFTYTDAAYGLINGVVGADALHLGTSIAGKQYTSMDASKLTNIHTIVADTHVEIVGLESADLVQGSANNVLKLVGSQGAGESAPQTFRVEAVGQMAAGDRVYISNDSSTRMELFGQGNFEMVGKGDTAYNINAQNLGGHLIAGGSDGADKIVVGSGGSDIAGSKGLDDVTFGAGVDVLKITDDAWASAATAENMVTIHNLRAGDKLDMSTAGGTGFTPTKIANVDDTKGLSVAVGLADEAASGVTWFVWNSDTYIVIAGSSAALVTDDNVIKIAGTTGFDLAGATFDTGTDILTLA